jgi:hypothetical protein
MRHFYAPAKVTGERSKPVTFASVLGGLLVNPRGAAMAGGLSLGFWILPPRWRLDASVPLANSGCRIALS